MRSAWFWFCVLVKKCRNLFCKMSNFGFSQTASLMSDRSTHLPSFRTWKPSWILSVIKHSRQIAIFLYLMFYLCKSRKNCNCLLEQNNRRNKGLTPFRTGGIWYAIYSFLLPKAEVTEDPIFNDIQISEKQNALSKSS